MRVVHVFRRICDMPNVGQHVDVSKLCNTSVLLSPAMNRVHTNPISFPGIPRAPMLIHLGRLVELS